VPYPEDYLHPDEELVLHLHPHWWYMVKSSAALVVAVVFGLVVLVQDWPDPVKFLAALFVVAALVWFAERFLRWVSTHFVLTSSRVIYRSGIVAKSGIEIPLGSINAIHFEQGVLERILGLGDLRIDSASIAGVSVFDDIRKPDMVQNEIYREKEASSQRSFTAGSAAAAAATATATPTPPVDPATSVPDQLERLHALRQQGAITPEEYEAKKTELLGRM
jgi:uncharacterized membrane protein YdbT with pleckstrin-like domain